MVKYRMRKGTAIVKPKDGSKQQSAVTEPIIIRKNEQQYLPKERTKERKK